LVRGVEKNLIAVKQVQVFPARGSIVGLEKIQRFLKRIYTIKFRTGDWECGKWWMTPFSFLNVIYVDWEVHDVKD
jgi:hypothetical protein